MIPLKLPFLLILSLLTVCVVSFRPSQGKCEIRRVTAKSSPNDIVVGNRKQGDSLVNCSHFFREANPSKRIIAFRPFDVANEYTITQVRALDQTNGTGGIVTYEYGGPGMTRVLLGFHSKINQGVEYIIELYAEPYEG
ncbi:probable salivary secreted peptide [Copidosoma floridanum]|uniref:probable salivary secreted peptide n=1 Tax=Copidosoma floridanum TaxID=29053 RepID=UPI0006C964D0|nr:probable salivary secreted peptide [Copidosoma floridanum]